MSEIYCGRPRPAEERCSVAVPSDQLHLLLFCFFLSKKDGLHFEEQKELHFSHKTKRYMLEFQRSRVLISHNSHKATVVSAPPCTLQSAQCWAFGIQLQFGLLLSSLSYYWTISWRADCKIGELQRRLNSRVCLSVCVECWFVLLRILLCVCVCVVRTGSALSLLYGTSATLEHHHFNHAVMILQSEVRCVSFSAAVHFMQFPCFCSCS